uniref:Ligand-dependent nuclear receptor corepressor-like protein n=1 Tax=Monopterus albus TaxID=43700 RepID=A0A3Q3Q9P4_MONAL
MASVQCSKCTVERKGIRRELDSWRHKLIHCVGFESILEGVYGPVLLRDLNLFDDCEPEEVDDWSPEASCSQCSFCNLPLDKLSDQVPAATSPVSSSSDYSPCQITESSQSAHRFLQAVFHKKDVPLGCDSNIPLVAQELMKKMIHKFAMEYASKCLLHTSTNGVTTRTSSTLLETSDAPLDLTVSRTQEEKDSQSEPDCVLDLSNRSCAGSATSSNHKAAGSLLPSLTEELGDLAQRKTKCHQSSVLDAVLSSLCPSHRSLLYRILKLAHQEKLLSFLNRRPVGQTESYCCHCSVNPQDSVNPHAVPFSECKAHNGSLNYSLRDCDHQGHGSTMAVYHPGDCKSICSIHHYPLKNCESEAPLGSSYCCVRRCRMETYTVLCTKRLHCISCQSPAVGHNNTVCSSLSRTPSLCTPSSVCPSSSICCNHPTSHSCPCYSNHACLMQVRNITERGDGDGDPPCPVLKRELSPSPPPLSPVSSDIIKKTDEKPPSLLHHIQEEEADLMVKNGLVNASHHETVVCSATERELQCTSPRSCQAKQNPSGFLLQEVVNRFTEKLETIRPLEKDTPLVSTTVNASEKEQPQSPSKSQNLHFHADAHLTEIITKVLHKGSASDYNLSELFNRHDSKEHKSPNTRSRSRQDVLAAIGTPADNASTRRLTLQIKRDLAMLGQSYNKRKVPPAKRARLKNGNVTVITSDTSSDSSPVKESERKLELDLELVENDRVKEEPLNMLSAESDKDEVKEEMQTVTVTGEVQTHKAEEKERETFSEEKDPKLADMETPTLELQSMYGKEGLKGTTVQTQVSTLTAPSVKQCGKLCEEDGKGSCAVSDRNHEEAPSGQTSDSDNSQGKDCSSTIRDRWKRQLNQEARRSRRNIVPPQRFASYVTEPRKMFFVACFSESIFNQQTQKDKVLTSGITDALSSDPDANDAHPESRNETPSSLEYTGKLAFESTRRKRCEPSWVESKAQCQASLQTLAAKEKSLAKHGSDNRTDGSDCADKSFGRLRSSPKKRQVLNAGTPNNPSYMNVTIKSATCVEKPPNSQVQYTSPIKLMFVSPVNYQEGVRYSLKSAGSGSSAQAVEPFDPCEMSLWSGTPEKRKSQSTDSATSKIKSSSVSLRPATLTTRSACSPAKSASSTPNPASSPSKSTSSPAKSGSSTPKQVSSPSKSVCSPAKSCSSTVKSALSSPKTGFRRSGEGTPKRVVVTDSQRSPCDLSFHETTPPKRRPGRPKKLGPQLEQKVKRPIGRPRKQKVVDSETGAKIVNCNSVSASNIVENVSKNLKITVVYGRSRRNKRMVSESFDQLQTEFHDAWQAVGLKSDLGILMQSSKTSSGGAETASTELSEELHFVSPVKESAPQSNSNIKCQNHDDSVPLRKPGRPAKVKISGISVTVTTVSPRRRKIQINKDTRQSPETLIQKKVPLPEFRSPKEPWTISHHSSKSSRTEKGSIHTKDEGKDKQSDQPVAVRHSTRVRKPSIHFLHAVATSTSRSYSHSNALLRRSKQLLLNKASYERRKEEQQSRAATSGEKRQLCEHERKNISQDLSRVAGVSVDSIFTPTETLRWWVASAEENTMRQELVRRIRHISDTWVSDTVENEEKEIAFNPKLGTKNNSSFTRKSKHSSVVRTLFDCPPNKPRSCSMQQLCSWFMQTTETQSLAIVKKASSRNPYELMHFPRSANKKNLCPSPQAERLRKHIKKFAKTVPKTPLQHQQAQRRLRKRNKALLPTHNIRRQLFTPRFATGRLNQTVQWWTSRAFSKYQVTLFRARIRFQTRKERERWQKRQGANKKAATSCSNGHVVTELQPRHKAPRKLAKHQLSNCLEKSSATSSVDQTQEPLDVSKEQNLCSKAW